jgi:hypothetical protein
MGPALYDRVHELYARNGVTPPMVPTPGPAHTTTPA